LINSPKTYNSIIWISQTFRDSTSNKKRGAANGRPSLFYSDFAPSSISSEPTVSKSSQAFALPSSLSLGIQ